MKVRCQVRSVPNRLTDETPHPPERVLVRQMRQWDDRGARAKQEKGNAPFLHLAQEKISKLVRSESLFELTLFLRSLNHPWNGRIEPAIPVATATLM